MKKYMLFYFLSLAAAVGYSQTEALLTLSSGFSAKIKLVSVDSAHVVYMRTIEDSTVIDTVKTDNVYSIIFAGNKHGRPENFYNFLFNRQPRIIHAETEIKYLPLKLEVEAARNITKGKACLIAGPIMGAGGFAMLGVGIHYDKQSKLRNNLDVDEHAVAVSNLIAGSALIVVGSALTIHGAITFKIGKRKMEIARKYAPEISLLPDVLSMPYGNTTAYGSTLTLKF